VVPEEAIWKYIENCRSGFGDGLTRELIPQVAVIQWLRANLSAWDETIRSWLSRFEEAMPRVEQFLETVPDDWYPPMRRALAARLLRERLAWLKEHAHAAD